MNPSVGVTASSLPDATSAYCPVCGCHAVPRKKAGAWSKVKAVLWESDRPLTLDEVAAAAGIARNAAAVALSHHKRELNRQGKPRMYLYSLRWRT